MVVNESFSNITNCSYVITEYNNMSLIILLNHKKAIFLLPVTLLIAAISLFGLLGNSVVCYIHQTKFKKTTGNFFIVALSVLDLLTCLIACPFQLFDMSHPYFSGNIICCKLFRFIEMSLTGAAGVMLVSIAFDRHAKVCNPLRSRTLGQARHMIVITAALCISVAWPQLFLSGVRFVETRFSCVVGEDCSIASEYEGSIYALLAYFVQYILFVLSVICIFTSYAHIIFIIATRKKTLTSLKRKQGNAAAEPDSEFKIHVSTGSKKIKANKTTFLMMAVTASTILCYVPYLSVEIMKHNGVVFKPGMSAAMEIVSEICLKSYFLGRVMNPLIYFILNDQFRSECISLLKCSKK